MLFVQLQYLFGSCIYLTLCLINRSLTLPHCFHVLVDSIFKRIGDPVTGVVPSSRHIMEDIWKIIIALKKIVAARGCVVHGLMKHPGHWGNVAVEGAPENQVKNHDG